MQMSKGMKSPTAAHQSPRTKEPAINHPENAPPQGLLLLSLLVALGGVAIGLLGAGFRYSLMLAEGWRTTFIEWTYQWGWAGIFLPVILAALGAALARFLIQYCPLAAGSGVQHVEALMRGEVKPGPFAVIPVKFVGGLLAIGGGLALGREGPTIQMGSILGSSLAKWFRLPISIMRDLQAALGGAGLAVAFNAPLGGVLFVVEEVSHSFRLQLTLITLVGVAISITVSQSLLGQSSDFSVAPFLDASRWTLLVYLFFGSLLGITGVFYNKTTLFFMDFVGKLSRFSVEARAASIGAIIGILGWFSPSLIGGGETLNQEFFSSSFSVLAVLGIVAIRWVIGPLSYAAGTPGGIFSPLLLIGAGQGLLFALLFNACTPPEYHLAPTAFAVIGMSAFFTAVVRAPLTGIVLISEMTATTSLLLPMLAAGVGATLFATILRGQPIYDTLREHLIQSKIAELERPLTVDR